MNGPEVIERRLEVWPVKPSVKEGVSPCSADGRPKAPQDSHRPNGHHQEPTWRREPPVCGSFLSGMNLSGGTRRVVLAPDFAASHFGLLLPRNFGLLSHAGRGTRRSFASA